MDSNMYTRLAAAYGGDAAKMLEAVKKARGNRFVTGGPASRGAVPVTAQRDATATVFSPSVITTAIPERVVNAERGDVDISDNVMGYTPLGDALQLGQGIWDMAEGKWGSGLRNVGWAVVPNLVERPLKAGAKVVKGMVKAAKNADNVAESAADIVKSVARSAESPAASSGVTHVVSEPFLEQRDRILRASDEGLIKLPDKGVDYFGREFDMPDYHAAERMTDAYRERYPNDVDYLWRGIQEQNDWEDALKTGYASMFTGEYDMALGYNGLGFTGKLPPKLSIDGGNPNMLLLQVPKGRIFDAGDFGGAHWSSGLHDGSPEAMDAARKFSEARFAMDTQYDKVKSMLDPKAYSMRKFVPRPGVDPAELNKELSKFFKLKAANEAAMNAHLQTSFRHRYTMPGTGTIFKGTKDVSDYLSNVPKTSRFDYDGVLLRGMVDGAVGKPTGSEVIWSPARGGYPKVVHPDSQFTPLDFPSLLAYGGNLFWPGGRKKNRVRRPHDTDEMYDQYVADKVPEVLMTPSQAVSFNRDTPNNAFMQKVGDELRYPEELQPAVLDAGLSGQQYREAVTMNPGYEAQVEQTRKMNDIAPYAAAGLGLTFGAPAVIGGVASMFANPAAVGSALANGFSYLQPSKYVDPLVKSVAAGSELAGSLGKGALAQTVAGGISDTVFDAYWATQALRNMGKAGSVPGEIMNGMDVIPLAAAGGTGLAATYATIDRLLKSQAAADAVRRFRTGVLGDTTYLMRDIQKFQDLHDEYYKAENEMPDIAFGFKTPLEWYSKDVDGGSTGNVNGFLFPKEKLVPFRYTTPSGEEKTTMLRTFEGSIGNAGQDKTFTALSMAPVPGWTSQPYRSTLSNARRRPSRTNSGIETEVKFDASYAAADAHYNNPSDPDVYQNYRRAWRKRRYGMSDYRNVGGTERWYIPNIEDYLEMRKGASGRYVSFPSAMPGAGSDVNGYVRYVQDMLGDDGIVSGSSVLIGNDVISGKPHDTEILTTRSRMQNVKDKMRVSDGYNNGVAELSDSPYAQIDDRTGKGLVDIQVIDEDRDGNAIGEIAWQLYRTMHPEDHAEQAQRSIGLVDSYVDMPIINRATGKPYTADELFDEFKGGDYMLQNVVVDALSVDRSFNDMMKQNRPVAVLLNKHIAGEVSKAIDIIGKSQVGASFRKGSDVYKNVKFDDFEQNKRFLEKIGLYDENIAKDEDLMRNLFDYWYMQESVMKRGASGDTLDEATKYLLTGTVGLDNGTISGGGRNTVNVSHSGMAVDGNIAAMQVHLHKNPESVNSLDKVSGRIDELRTNAPADGSIMADNVERFLNENGIEIDDSIRRELDEMRTSTTLGDVDDHVTQIALRHFAKDRDSNRESAYQLVEAAFGNVDIPFLASSGYGGHYRGLYTNDSRGSGSVKAGGWARSGRHPTYEFGRDISEYSSSGNGSSRVVGSDVLRHMDDSDREFFISMESAADKLRGVKTAQDVDALMNDPEFAVFIKDAYDNREKINELAEKIYQLSGRLEEQKKKVLASSKEVNWRKAKKNAKRRAKAEFESDEIVLDNLLNLAVTPEMAEQYRITGFGDSGEIYVHNPHSEQLVQGLHGGDALDYLFFGRPRTFEEFKQSLFDKIKKSIRPKTKHKVTADDDLPFAYGGHLLKPYPPAAAPQPAAPGHADLNRFVSAYGSASAALEALFGVA